MKAIHSRAMERIQTGTASYGRQAVHASLAWLRVCIMSTVDNV